MSLTNSARHYGLISRGLHWLTALLILTVVPLGFIADWLSEGIRGGGADQAVIDRVVLLFSLHKTVGIAIFFTALLRILWSLTQPRPAPLHAERRAETWLAETVHWMLYGSLVLVPLTGWIDHAASTGFAPIWWPFGQTLPFVPEDRGIARLFGGLHVLFMWVLLISLALHIAGAMKHAVVDRDGTLARMVRGLPGGAGSGPHGFALLSAAAIWAGVVGIGIAAGAVTLPGTQTAQSARTESVGEWEVQQGTLGIEITQMGQTVTGSFAQWSADISYDPESGTGEVTVEIDISSLTLGSVTSQAMGPDYFAAEEYPTATFTAAITREDGQHVARGDLTMKGVTVPVDMPFDLQIDGQTAVMEGSTTLERANYGIGDGVAEGSLGMTVPVTVSLTAARGAP
ncbi:Cytochrome b561 [Poseidonocella pacifica]|uniref:Cytochrome b561 n=1 Tax=Poseidonocella pacifica TaxID=871651 RepID=A0A1I0VJG3_9RHOB|nr:cytochrome b/b6 domain-containing protein [Poseidonocella pacifica]SFA76534.1 Cytochrome b561 [Poseidonocella pacifica]